MAVVSVARLPASTMNAGLTASKAAASAPAPSDQAARPMR